MLALIENPQNSHFWKQDCWKKLEPEAGWRDFLVDYCVFGTAWRKSTRFRVVGVLVGEKQRCRCGQGHKHQVLRGWNRELGRNWTSIAEPYPKRLCHFLARNVKGVLGRDPRMASLDVAGCAKTGVLRVGEAAVPGPRVRRARLPVDLSAVGLVEPATAALQLRFWTAFQNWVESSAGKGALDVATRVPELLTELLASFAQVLYDSGAPLHYYRQLVAFVQRKHVNVRPFVRKAWEVVSRWELLEPVQHRPPLPEPLAGDGFAGRL